MTNLRKSFSGVTERKPFRPFGLKGFKSGFVNLDYVIACPANNLPLDNHSFVYILPLFGRFARAGWV